MPDLQYVYGQGGTKGHDTFHYGEPVDGNEVTTTDELIPSGETSSYRSNPLRLAEFALSRKDPLYVGRAKEIRSEEEKRRETGKLSAEILEKVGVKIDGNAMLGSAVVAKKPGDGSAREQAASCQRVLGGVANIALEYATKRYRSNLISSSTTRSATIYILKISANSFRRARRRYPQSIYREARSKIFISHSARLPKRKRRLSLAAV